MESRSLGCFLRQGEYEMFQGSPMFESDFFEINKEGKPIDVHNKKKIITLGVTSTIPTLPIPNTLLLASYSISSEEDISKPTSILHQHRQGNLELKRLFPLSLVKITIHNLEMKQLRLKLVTGRTYYLQLYPPSNQQKDLFGSWIKLVQLLRPSSKINFNQQKQESKKFEKHDAPLVPPLKPKKESQYAPEKRTKTKNKKSVCPVVQNPTAQAKETKKENNPTAVLSKSSSTPEIKPPPLEIENIHEAFCYTTPEEKSVAKNLERAKIKNPGAGGEKEKLDINRKSYRRNRSSQSRSGHRGTARKPSKITSLFIGCFGVHRKKKRSNRGKRYQAE